MDIEKWWTEKMCNNLSKRTITKENGEMKYLLANFSGTEQKIDIEKNTYTIGDFYRIKDNLKSDPNNLEQLEKAVKEQFDMPQWASKRLGLSLSDCNLTFMPQTKTCNLYCPWCFVDDKNKNGKKENGEFFSTKEIIDALEDSRKTQTIHVIRRSGGEPLLAPWQWLDNLYDLAKRGLDKEIYFQGETNLTTGHFIDYLQKQEQLDKKFFEKVAEYNNFGVLCSFKGTDMESNLKSIGFSRKDGTPNKKFAFLEEERWYTFRKMVNAGIDVYPFVYDPNPNTLIPFLERGRKEFGAEFISKTWIFPLKLYGPEKTRLQKKGIDKDIFQKQLDENFEIANEMMYDLVPKVTGHEYKAIPRTEIKIKPGK
ncbi:MAG: radical SAM protein, partial [Nanoarchaeota archaeon]